MRSVPIVDDDPSVRMAIRMALEGKYLIYTAATGAATDGKKGYFEATSGGTLLLDEIDALPISAQARFLENQY